jgi:hypothetical protein
MASGGEIPEPIDHEDKNAYIFFQDFEDMYAECTCGHYKDTEHRGGVCEVRGCGCQR